MIRLEGRQQYFLLDTTSEVFTRHDSTETIMKQLVSRRSTGHLMVIVAKGYKAKLVPVERELVEFQKKLVATMNSLE